MSHERERLSLEAIEGRSSSIGSELRAELASETRNLPKERLPLRSEKFAEEAIAASKFCGLLTSPPKELTELAPL